MNLAQAIATLIGVPAAIAIFIVWLCLRYFGAKLVEKRISKDVEKFKDELRQRAEVLKANLSVYAHEQNVAITRVDAQRAKAISLIYTAFRSWEKPVAGIIAGTHWEDAPLAAHIDFYRERAEEGHKAAGELLAKMGDFAIYFERDDYEVMSEVALSCSQSTAEFLRVIREGIAHSYPENQIFDAIERKRNDFKENAQNNMHAVETAIVPMFRALLGAYGAHLGQ